MPFFDPIRIGASGAADTAFTVDRSLRFNRSDSTYLTKSLGSTSNRRTFTYSFWVKRTVQDAEQCLIYNGHPSSTPYGEIRFEYQSGNIHELNFYSYDGSHQFQFRTNRKFRDPSAWYHIVLALDTTQSTQSNRVKIYVNGEQETTFTTATYPSQDVDTAYNVSGNTHSIGGFRNTSNSFDGYVAEFNFIDGFQYDPSYFAETDAITGQWNPKKYTGSYGTNGFYLNFSDNSGTTATTLGKDSSGNGNNFTPNNFSVAAGTGNDSLEDTPTNNFATLNALKKPTNGAISNGNLDGSGNASAWVSFFSTILVSSGKWFCEVKVNATRVGVGIAKDGADENSYLGSAADTYAYFDLNGKWNNNSDSAYGATYTTNDIIGMALDMDAGTLIFYKNGASQGTAFTGLSGEFALGFTVYGGSASASINYGQRAFDYTVPTGYKTLCSANLPDPTIKLPNKHFDSLLYTGDGASSKAITGLNFSPDWVWTKRRSGSDNHMMFDSVRGASTARLFPNLTSAEDGNFGSINSFDSNGFTVGNNVGTNANGQTFVAWNWDAGATDSATYTVKVVSDSGNKYRFNDFGTSAVTLDLAEGGTYIFDQSDSSNAGHPLRFSTTSNGTHGGGSEYTTGVTTAGTPGSSGAYTQIVVAASAPTLYYYCTQHSGMGGQANTNSTLGSSNFDGSVQSTVKVNASAGFSIITYTRNGGSITVGHGLGVAPKIYIRKRRDTTDSWIAYNTLIDGSMDYLILNSTDAKYDSGFSAPTSTIFNDDSSGNMVVYAFSEVAGYSKFGSYTGNGSSDGTFVFTGFKPAWIMTKRSDGGSQNWLIHDIKRDPHNVANKKLAPNLSYEENNSSYIGSSSQDTIDILSNGFKMRSNNNHTNISGGTFIYLAFAESPFKNARAR